MVLPVSEMLNTFAYKVSKTGGNDRLTIRIILE